jgi:hypothetical protein
MRRTISIVSFALLALAAAGAKAQEKPQEIGDVTEYTFPDEAVVGGIPGADEVRVTVRPKGKSHSLIRVRTHFVRAMLLSVEDI